MCGGKGCGSAARTGGPGQKGEAESAVLVPARAGLGEEDAGLGQEEGAGEGGWGHAAALNA